MQLPTGVDWTLVGPAAMQAVTAILIGILTVLLVRYNRRLANEAKESRRVAQQSLTAATGAAVAATEQTRATTEALQLDWRPVLAHSFPATPIPGALAERPRIEQVAEIKNVGRGPALNVYVAVSELLLDGLPPRVMEGWAPACAAGATESVSLRPATLNQFHISDETWKGAGDWWRKRLIFCQDRAGNVYRFVPPQPLPEMVAVGDSSNPWAEGYRAQVANHVVDEEGEKPVVRHAKGSVLDQPADRRASPGSQRSGDEHT
jgi:hypothetical protein